MNRHPFSYLEVLSFVLFISLGYWIGKGIADFRTAPIELKVAAPTPSPIPSLPDGERILLLVGVDQIDNKQPQLVSLWLLTYYLNNQPIQLLPIYPGINGRADQFEDELLNAFSILPGDGAAQLNPTFLQLLKDHNYWLSGYLILDTEATAQIIDMFGGLSNDHKLRSGKEIMQALPDSEEQPQSALYQQTNLFEQACLILSQLPRQPDWSQILRLLPDHIITDLQPYQLLAEIQMLASNPTLVHCEFPIRPTTP